MLRRGKYQIGTLKAILQWSVLLAFPKLMEWFPGLIEFVPTKPLDFFVQIIKTQMEQRAKRVRPNPKQEEELRKPEPEADGVNKTAVVASACLAIGVGIAVGKAMNRPEVIREANLNFETDHEIRQRIIS